MIVKEFSASSDYLENTKTRRQTKAKHEDMLRLLYNYLNSESKVLDTGERNPFTTIIENAFKIEVDNTDGDLDVDFSIPQNNYNVIICSHVIEHIFNPLHMLLKLKEVLTDDGIIILALPQRTKLLWTKVHFHEIDDYRIRVLFKRAGFEVAEKIKQKVKREWWSYFTGFRPILRFFLEYNAVYIIKKSKIH